jgi:hypothetical protein
MTRAASAAPPAPLLVAASLTAIEGLLLVGQAIVVVATASGARAAMDITTSIFFVAYAAALVFCAWALTRGSSWARSPVVLAQLIQLGVATSFWGGDTTLIAVALAVTAVIVLVGVLHPASVDHLADDPS